MPAEPSGRRARRGWCSLLKSRPVACPPLQNHPTGDHFQDITRDRSPSHIRGGYKYFETQNIWGFPSIAGVFTLNPFHIASGLDSNRTGGVGGGRVVSNWLFAAADVLGPGRRSTGLGSGLGKPTSPHNSTKSAGSTIRGRALTRNCWGPPWRDEIGKVGSCQG